jgi:glucokinase
MLNVLSPQRVVLGGGVVEAFGDVLLDRVRRSAHDHCFAIACESTEIVLAELGDDAGVLGASELARDRVSGSV